LQSALSLKNREALSSVKSSLVLLILLILCDMISTRRQDRTVTTTSTTTATAATATTAATAAAVTVVRVAPLSISSPPPPPSTAANAKRQPPRKRSAAAATPSSATNLEAIDENEGTEEIESTPPGKRARAAVWTRDEIEKLLKSVLAYAKENGLPASTKPTTSTARDEKKIPSGWSTIAAAVPNRTPIQALRKFDNLKTDVCSVYEHILKEKKTILFTVARKVLIKENGYTPSEEETAEFADKLNELYNIKINHPCDITFVVETDNTIEPWEDVHEAILLSISSITHGAFLFDTVAPLQRQINDHSAPLHLPKKKKSKQKAFQLTNDHIADMDRDEAEHKVVEDTDDNGDTTDSTESRRPRRRDRHVQNQNDEHIRQSVASIAKSASNLENILQSAMLKPIHEKFPSLAELFNRLHASDGEMAGIMGLGVRETYDLAIVDHTDIKRELTNITYKRLRALTSNTNLKLPE
jgi:hypothetical protein